MLRCCSCAPDLDAKFFWGSIPLLGLAFALSTWIHNSRFGYRLRAIRENEATAMAVGVNPAVDKLLALLPSAMVTALAGSIYASYFSFVGPDTVLTIEISVQAALIAMLGGAATVWGPILGSIVLTLTAELFKTYFEHTHLVVYGALLIVVVVFLPGGVISLFQRRWKFRRQTGAHRRAAVGRSSSAMARILEFEKVSKRFGGLLATNDVSFHVDEGEIVFLIGPNGAGKTTVFNLITGYVKPDCGHHPLRRQGHHRRRAVPGDAAGHRADLPGGAAVAGAHRAGERDARDVPPAPAPRGRRGPRPTRCSSSWACGSARTSWPAGSRSPSASCSRWRGPSAPGRSSSCSTR